MPSRLVAGRLPVVSIADTLQPGPVDARIIPDLTKIVYHDLILVDSLASHA